MKMLREMISFFASYKFPFFRRREGFNHIVVLSESSIKEKLGMLQHSEERHPANRIFAVLTKSKIFPRFLPPRLKVGAQSVTVLQCLRRSKPPTPTVYSVACSWLGL